MIDNGDNDGSSGIGSDNVYRGRVEPMLILLSDLYSEEKILVCDSRSSSCPVYTFYCLFFFFNYCLSKIYMILS